MPASHAVSFKLKVVERFLRTKNARGTAREFGLSDSTVRSWAQSTKKLQAQPREAKQLKGAGREVRDQALDSTQVETAEPGDPAEVHCSGIKQEMEGTLPDDVTVSLQGPRIGAIKIEADVDKLEHFASNHSSSLPSLEQSEDLKPSFQTPGTYHCSDSDPQSSHDVQKWVVESSAILPQMNHMENYECGQLGVVNTPTLKEEFSDKGGLGNSFADLDAASFDQNVQIEHIKNVKPSMETDTVMPVSGDTVTSGFSYHHETVQRQVRETGGKRGTSIKYILRKTVDGEIVYQCPVCGKLYGYLGSLATHQHIHMGPKPYRCSICGKGFARKDHLNRHQRIHSLPYKCLVCSQGFSELGHLSIHQSKHGKNNL